MIYFIILQQLSLVDLDAMYFYGKNGKGRGMGHFNIPF